MIPNQTMPSLELEMIETVVELALKEDLPDITSEAIFSPDEPGRARFIARAPGIVAGLPLARAVFAFLDRESGFSVIRPEGSTVSDGEVIAEVEGTVRALLSGERTALNLMQRAAGIATMTRRYVEAVAGTAAQIVDTRKTAPGLRLVDKYAVAVGGGLNHRIGLFDMFLVKNNHIDRAGSIDMAIRRIRATGRSEPLMVEVRNLEELEEAVAGGPDYILLDNMTVEAMSEAVRRVGGRIPLEASGGIELETIRAVAESGVDRISIGALTHSVRALDISFRITR
jgi:nicotinate-nucleotide pyrophosphorylase (carboxylating)